MKKTMKKVITMVLTMCMVLAMSVTVFADETAATASITAPNNGHTYEAFQIFTGEIADGQLQNIKWGANGTGTADTYVSADVTNELAALTSSTSDTTKLATIEHYVDLTSTAAYTIEAGKTVTVTPGYYLLRDKGDQVTGDDVATLYVVKVAGAVTFSPKGEKPTVQKKVYEENKGWQDGATYDIGDDVPYELTATIPDISAYKTYYVQFDDTLTSGLTYNEDAKVYVVNGDTKTDVTDKFNIEYDKDTMTLYVTCNDIKALGSVSEGTKIVVDYTTELNTNAVIGSTGNPNEVKLVYSNNPNTDQSGDHGTTPEDKVTVWTFKLVADKVDGNGDALKGAGFTLYKGTGDSKTAIGEEVNGTDLTSFEFKGLDEGTYTLVETTVPTGYNQADDVVFTITATYDTEAADPQLKTLTVDNTNVTVKSVASGELDTTIKNYTGATLPTTGGMGTTLFYVVGMILVLGAGVVLVARRRMAR